MAQGVESHCPFKSSNNDSRCRNNCSKVRRDFLRPMSNLSRLRGSIQGTLALGPWRGTCISPVLRTEYFHVSSQMHLGVPSSGPILFIIFDCLVSRGAENARNKWHVMLALKDTAKSCHYRPRLAPSPKCTCTDYQRNLQIREEGSYPVLPPLHAR